LGIVTPAGLRPLSGALDTGKMASATHGRARPSKRKPTIAVSSVVTSAGEIALPGDAF
jgi:hypothetical protein